VGGGIGESILARADVPLAPRRNHLELGSERLVRELESDLVIPLPGAAVG
jgi:hypothetical protein